MTAPVPRDLVGAATAVHDLVASYRAEAAATRTRLVEDPTVPADAQATAVNDAMQLLRERYGARLDVIATRARTEVATLAQRAAEALPAPRPGVEALLRRQAHWARIQSMLTGGVRPLAIIANATDPELLHALAEELPAAVAVDRFPGSLESWQRAVTGRLATLSGPAAVAAQDALQSAEAHLKVLEPILTRAAAEIGATDHRYTSHADYADELARYGLRPYASRMPHPGL